MKSPFTDIHLWRFCIYVSLEEGCPSFFGYGPQPFMWAVWRASRVKITLIVANA